MGELYGGREAEIGRSLKSTRVQESRDRESTEGLENSIRIVAPRILGCLTVRVSWNSIFIHQSRIVLSSTLALSFYIAVISSRVGSAPSRYILKNRKTHAWSKNGSKNSKQRRVGIIRQNVGDGAWCRTRARLSRWSV